MSFSTAVVTSKQNKSLIIINNHDYNLLFKNLKRSRKTIVFEAKKLNNDRNVQV